MNINLHIEQHILDGVYSAPVPHHLLQANVITELNRMLNNDSQTRNIVGGAVFPRSSINSIQIKAYIPMETGQQIAQSGYGGIGRE